MCQHVARLQFDSCAEKDSLSGTVMMAWIWHVWINAMVFVGWRQRFFYKVYSLNLIDEFTSLFSPKVIVAGLPRESFPHAFVDVSVFCRCASNSQDSPKASPRAFLKWKTSIEPLKLLKAECQHAPICAIPCQHGPTWANIAVCQLCRERQPFWNSHDGLNLTCLDQCHGVRWLTHCWRQRIVIKSTV